MFGLHEHDLQLMLQGKDDQLRRTREMIDEDGCSFQSLKGTPRKRVAAREEHEQNVGQFGLKKHGSTQDLGDLLIQIYRIFLTKPSLHSSAVPADKPSSS